MQTAMELYSKLIADPKRELERRLEEDYNLDLKRHRDYTEAEDIALELAEEIANTEREATLINHILASHLESLE
jgi:hypothetical protein